MKACLDFQKDFNIVSFRCKGLNLSFTISPMIHTIYSIDEYDLGYMVIQTNVGEEYIDLLGMLEMDNCVESFYNFASSILSNISLKDIKLRG